MNRWPILMVLVLLMAGCQSNALLRDYDPGRDFGAYRTWQWQEPAVLYSPDNPRLRSDLTEQRLRDAMLQEMEQRGLRQAAPGQPADLQVQVSLMLDTRIEEFRSLHGGYWGYPWYGPVFQDVRTYEYEVRTVQIDLFDGRDGRLIWRAAREDLPDAGNAHPSERSAALQRSVRALLQYYPPQ